MAAEVSSEVQACSADGLAHAAGYPAQSCSPTVSWAAAGVEKARRTLKKSDYSSYISHDSSLGKKKLLRAAQLIIVNQIFSTNKKLVPPRTGRRRLIE